MPIYEYIPSAPGPTAVPIRWDTDATSGIPALIYNPAGGLIDQVNGGGQITDALTGVIPTVWGDAATVYVRRLDFLGGNPLPGVLATIQGLQINAPPTISVDGGTL